MAKTFQRATICAVMQSGGTERDRSGVPFEKKTIALLGFANGDVTWFKFLDGWMKDAGDPTCW